jgi:hypothetical protein
VTPALTFHRELILESQFSKTLRRRAILQGEGDSGFIYSGIFLDEISVSSSSRDGKVLESHFDQTMLSDLSLSG